MRDAVGAAERIAQRVDGHGARGSDRHATVERGQQHIFARFHIGAVFIRPAQILGDELNALEAEHSGKGVRFAGDIGLNAVTERIDARGSSDGLGKASRQLRIEQHAARQEVRMHNADLELLFRDEDDGVRRRFRAGAGRGRGHQQRRAAVYDLALIGQIVIIAGVRHHDRDDLRGIHDTAAADGDNGVCAAVFDLTVDLTDLPVFGLGRNIADQREALTGGLERLDRGIDRAGLQRAHIREERDLFLIELFQQLRQLRDAACAGNDSLRYGQNIRIHHKTSSFLQMATRSTASSAARIASSSFSS